ncbi:MAG: M28 family peptidase [Alphaproteobacteria bacterium]|nr:M28 family peptidase [Alphaproteobacteria bacterium]
MTNHLNLIAALSALALIAGCGKSGEKAKEAAAVPATTETSPDITGADLKKHIAMLASDDFEGRAPMTPGGKKARDYIAAQMKRIGIEPIGDSYFQPVPFVKKTIDPSKSYLKINVNGAERALAYKSEAVYTTKRAKPVVSFDNSDMVFVGYGIVAPEYNWNDYAGVDVKGKTVVILINDPGFATKDPNLFKGNAMTYYGRWTYKYEEAARQGAAAAIIIHETAPAAYPWQVVESSWSGAQVDLKSDDDGASRCAMEGWVTNDVAHELFKDAGLDLDQLEKAAAKPGFKAVPMTGLKASGEITQAIERASDDNVIGVVRGTEAPNEYVLYTAHWDHLGVKPGKPGEDNIYNGAVDNASGVAAILEIGEKFVHNPPKRSVIIASVTAEESGLLGSAYMADHPPTPLKDIVGGINIDALLPTPKTKDLIVVGYGASEMEDVLQEAAARHSMHLTPDPEPEKGYYYRSDHISFAKKGVPMLDASQGDDFVDGGVAAGEAFAADYTAHRYHQPSDELTDDWDFSGMTETTQILYETGALIANSSAWPTWYDGNEFKAIRDKQRAGATGQ